MISIKEAIKQSREMPNISDGGSACYDFGDAVLVKYTLPLKYVKLGHRSRECQEKVMERINIKASLGVNTPKHLEMLRIIDNGNDICYVLQEKCKGKNCGSLAQYGATIDKVLEDLTKVNNIPSKHYEKLISDACMLYEMGYECKNKNLFYDEETGFWFIDFLFCDENQEFDSNDPKKVFETLKYICPKPIQLASVLNYNAEVSEYEEKSINSLRYSSKAKFLAACRKVIPTFSKYEFFYLLLEEDGFKKYLMENGFTSRNLFSASTKDFMIYNELFKSVVDDICKEISTEGKQYWEVEVNEIRNKSRLFGLQTFYQKYICLDANKKDEDDLEYENTIRKLYTDSMLDSIYDRLCTMEINENISSFISEYESKKTSGISQI